MLGTIIFAAWWDGLSGTAFIVIVSILSVILLLALILFVIANYTEIDLRLLRMLEIGAKKTQRRENANDEHDESVLRNDAGLESVSSGDEVLMLEMLPASLIQQIFGHLHQMDLETVAILKSDRFAPGNCESQVLAFTLARRMLQHAQELFRTLWPDGEIAASIKTHHPDDASLLQCYYIEDERPTRVPARRQGTGGMSHPLEIPKSGTAAGSVLVTGRPKIIPDVHETGAYSGEVFDLLKELHIGGVMAWPIFFDGATVAVLKVDSRTPNLFQDCPFIEFLMQQISTKMQLAFRVAARNESLLTQENADSDEEQSQDNE